MSVRVYQLSKQIGMENQDLIALLKERGYNVKSASSTIDNISAESLVQEFGARNEEQAGPSAEQDAGNKISPGKAAPIPNLQEREPAKPMMRSPFPPSDAFVKTKAQVDREREEKQEEQRGRRSVIFPAQRPLRSPTLPRSRPGPSRPRPQSIPSPIRQGSRVTRPPLRSRYPRQDVSRSRPATASPKPVPAPSGSPPVSSSSSSPPALNAPLPLGGGTVSVRTAPAAPPSVKIGAQPAEATDVSIDPASQKALQVKPPIVIRDFAGAIELKPFQLISEVMEMGIFASMNQVIEEDVATRIAAKHGYRLEVRHRGEAQPKEPKKKKPKVDESKLLEPRAPVVCILGHVDHGKTTLLDTIRKTDVVAGEAGGITQHIGAYQIEHKGQRITFVDTPGHAAFSKMRARGANVTDLAILLVAADDGFMPQTDEALGHAKAAGVPIIIAINKIDAKGANVDRIQSQMQERGIASEALGGETITVSISALEGTNIVELLEMILLQAEIMELRVNPRTRAEGVVIEAQKEIGRGSTASVIVQKGTLKIGDALVCGPHHCKVRALMDDKGNQIKRSGPSTPISIMGWSGTPEAGSVFEVVKNERLAKRSAEEAEVGLKREAETAAQPTDKPTSIENLFAAIAETQRQVFRVVVKADVFGTAEAVDASLTAIESTKVTLEAVQIGVGPVSQSDVLIASASEASIVGFNVNLEQGVSGLAKHHGVNIHLHNIIYELIDLVKDLLVDTLKPELKESKLGAAGVREVFPVARGFASGCLVTEGRIMRDAKARVLRNGEPVFESSIQTLRRFKDDANDVRAGYECGIRLKDFDGYEPGDVIECFEIVKIRASL